MNFAAIDSDYGGNENANCAKFPKLAGGSTVVCRLCSCHAMYGIRTTGPHNTRWEWNQWENLERFSLKKGEMKIRPRENHLFKFTSSKQSFTEVEVNHYFSLDHAS